MLDINNIHVSSANHGFAATAYVDSIAWGKVLQCHVAGHTVNADGTILDTHDAPVSQAVWELYRYAWKRSGGFRTLLERDGDIPAFGELHDESRRALAFRETA